ncbi:hypothetical protein J2W67_000001 [Acinetobacter calcoaceticus]|nr:hypothetical protein [Acinetobacter calcoaceticus]
MWWWRGFGVGMDKVIDFKKLIIKIYLVAEVNNII